MAAQQTLTSNYSLMILRNNSRRPDITGYLLVGRCLSGRTLIRTFMLHVHALACAHQTRKPAGCLAKATDTIQPNIATAAQPASIRKRG